MTEPIPLEIMFETRRSKNRLSLLLYSPIGIFLVIIRVIIGLQAFILSCLLPRCKFRRNLLKLNCQILGLSVEVEGESNINRDVKVLVANHISKIDHLTVNLVYPCILPGVWDLPKFLEWALGIKDLGARQGTDTLIKNTKSFCKTSKEPILTHPEGATTNGKMGVLRFGTWPFSLDQPVQPVSIQRVGCYNVELTVIGSRWWTDLLWMFFLPMTKFKIKILPVVRKIESETTEEFSKRVHQIIATDLRLTPTNFTCSDKLEYVKKILFKQPRKSVSSSGLNQIESLSLQVKEILPAVPLSVIKKDIAKTKSVNTTIMHLLEGTIAYIPEENQPSSSQSTSLPKPPPVASTAAKSFLKSSKERVLSLQERKRNLLESARRRYIDKHGLNIA